MCVASLQVHCLPLWTVTPTRLGERDTVTCVPRVRLDLPTKPSQRLPVIAREREREPATLTAAGLFWAPTWHAPTQHEQRTYKHQSLLLQKKKKRGGSTS